MGSSLTRDSSPITLVLFPSGANTGDTARKLQPAKNPTSFAYCIQYGMGAQSS